VHKKDPYPQPTDHPIKKLREHITDSSRGYQNFDKKRKKEGNFFQNSGAYALPSLHEELTKNSPSCFFPAHKISLALDNSPSLQAKPTNPKN
jgi:hypothetical protein